MRRLLHHLLDFPLGSPSPPNDPNSGLARLSGAFFWLAAATMAVLASAPASAQEAPLVAVASNAAEAVTETARRFGAQTGTEVRLSIGASGNLVRQIERGAPFELFLSADEDRPQRLVDAGLTRGAGAVYAVGRLAVWAREGSALRLPGPARSELAGIEALTTALTAPDVRRLAIANPEHAPYGDAARAVLERAGAWDALAGRLVLGENVGQAARFAVSPDVDGGLLPLSIVRGSALEGRGGYVLVPDAWHAPLRQRMVLLRGAGPGAEAFYRYMLGPAAREVLEARGYHVPDRSP